MKKNHRPRLDQSSFDSLKSNPKLENNASHIEPQDENPFDYRQNLESGERVLESIKTYFENVLKSQGQ